MNSCKLTRARARAQNHLFIYLFTHIYGERERERERETETDRQTERGLRNVFKVSGRNLRVSSLNRNKVRILYKDMSGND